MSRVVAQSDLSNISDEKQFMQYCSKLLSEIVSVINGKTDFDTNLSTQTVSVRFTNANTDLSIPHNLGRTGLKYFAVKKSAACDVYDGATTATKSTIYLRSTVATTVTLVLF